MDADEAPPANDIVTEDATGSDTKVEDETSKSKKRGKKNKSNSSSTKDEPVAKKLRVKPEKIKEVYDKIIAELKKNAMIGLMEVPIDVLTTSIGYKNPRSDAPMEALKLLVKDGLVEKKKNMIAFTDLGKEKYVPKEAVPANKEEALELFWKNLKMKLESSPKTSGDKAMTAARAIWELLTDGKAHTEKEVLAVTHYGMPRSTGYQEIMKAFKELGYTEGKVNGEFKMADKVFRFGRP